MSDSYDHPEDSNLILPDVSAEDVEQEYQLMLAEYMANPLKGAKQPSRALIRKRLLGRQGELSFDDVPRGAGSIGLPEDEIENRLQAANQILEWALEQDEEALNIILEFLEDPSEHALVITTNRLVKLGFIEQPPEADPVSPSSGTLAELLKRQLSQAGQLEMEELYTIARESHTSRRPNAAVRQTIRRFTEQGLVSRSEDTIIWRGY